MKSKGEKYERFIKNCKVGGGAILSFFSVFETCQNKNLCYNSDIYHHNIARLKMTRFKGVTLAEVLITLGIIGVVAAMTMPLLIANYKKQEVATKVKKVYSILSQATLRAVEDNGEYQYWDNAKTIGAEEYFNQYYKPYLSIIKVCYDYCGYDRQNPWKRLNGSYWEYSVFVNDFRQPFILSDGTLIVISIASGSADIDDAEYSNLIYFDINANKPPNMLGKDTFIFTRSDKGIFPYGFEQDESAINSNCSKAGAGVYCAAKIMRDGWQIKKDYPW